MSEPVHTLKRETVLPREQRGGLGAVALLCSLAGVASGFALATTILATQLAQSEARFGSRDAATFYQRDRAYLGVLPQTQPDGSTRIVRVVGGTPAAQIGLQPGDTILRFDGEPIDEPGELVRLVGRSPIGHETNIEVRRGEHTLVFRPTLIRR